MGTPLEARGSAMDQCSACGAPYHQATGHRWTEKLVLCGACARDWQQWLKAREAAMRRVKKGMRSSFIDAALTSIRPDGRGDEAQSG